jgi:hypothetical protein
MPSEKALESNPQRLPPMKPSTLSGYGVLTNSEIEYLRRRKKQIGAFAQKAFANWKRDAESSE